MPLPVPAVSAAHHTHMTTHFTVLDRGEEKDVGRKEKGRMMRKIV
jgi:hypothetical protein